MSAKAWTYRVRAKVARLVDGDTFHLTVDVGYRWSGDIVARLAGCNAAPKGTPEGDAATAYVAQWVQDHADRDGWLAVTTHKYEGDPHGRWLAEVQSLDGLHDLTDDLIAAGHAVVWGGDGPKPEPPPLAAA